MIARYGRAAWQVIAIAAFAGTAALAVVLTQQRPVALTDAVAACQAGGLDAWLGVGPDSGYYTLEFTNVSGQTCSIDGYPNVWAFAGGHPIGSQATTDTSVRPTVVTLAPYATAHAVLRYTATASFDAAACRRVTAPELRIYPPRIHQAIVLPLTFPACSRPGVKFLSVQPVQPREGIPGRYGVRA